MGIEETLMSSLVQSVQSAQKFGSGYPNDLNPTQLEQAVYAATRLINQYEWDVERVIRFIREYVYVTEINDEIRRRVAAASTQPDRTAAPVPAQTSTAPAERTSLAWLIVPVGQIVTILFLTSVGSWRLAGIAGFCVAVALWVPIALIGVFSKPVGKGARYGLIVAGVILFLYLFGEFIYWINSLIG